MFFPSVPMILCVVVIQFDSFYDVNNSDVCVFGVGGLGGTVFFLLVENMFICLQALQTDSAWL